MKESIHNILVVVERERLRESWSEKEQESGRTKNFIRNMSTRKLIFN